MGKNEQSKQSSPSSINVEKQKVLLLKRHKEQQSQSTSINTLVPPKSCMLPKPKAPPKHDAHQKQTEWEEIRRLRSQKEQRRSIINLGQRRQIRSKEESSRRQWRWSHLTCDSTQRRGITDQSTHRPYPGTWPCNSSRSLSHHPDPIMRLNFIHRINCDHHPSNLCQVLHHLQVSNPIRVSFILIHWKCANCQGD